MHGPEAVELLRTNLNYRGVIIGELKLSIISMFTLFYLNIIGITGNALPADISKLISSGVDEVVLKPISKAKLMDALIRNCETLR